MTTKYNVITRYNPREPEAPRRYYPSVKYSGRVTLRELSKQIAEISTVSTVDTMAVLEGLLTLIPREISRGNVVELGDFHDPRIALAGALSGVAMGALTAMATLVWPIARCPKRCTIQQPTMGQRSRA